MTDNAAISLDVSDIEAAVTFIDEAMNQGAYKGWELVIRVCNTRTRLATFVEAAKAQQAQKQTNEGENNS